jgi:hypothetical protein
MTAVSQSEVRREEIARERGRRRPTIVALRLAELNKLLTARYGERLPDDDSGRDDVAIVAAHLAGCPGDPARRISAWIALRAPWMSQNEIEVVIAQATAKPHRWKADTLAKRLGLKEAERRDLRITTIGAVDMTKEQRAAARRARKLERDRARAAKRRNAVGQKARADYLAAALTATKPWNRAGISRRTWERRRRRARVATPSPTIESLYAGRHTCDKFREPHRQFK